MRSTLKDAIRPIWRWFGKKSPIIASKLIYRKHFGKKLNLKNPKCFTEKTQWLKLFDYSKNPLVTQCVDKYAVREYVVQHGCAELLNDLLGQWDSVEQIEWSTLPSKFALKCTHGCGFNIICEDKNALDIELAKKKLKKWMSSKYDSDAVEMIYDNIQPRIICERYIESVPGSYPNDYKFFCSYGETKLIYVSTGNNANNPHYSIDYFTPDWKWIPVRNGLHTNSGANLINKPSRLKDMMDYARKLSSEFPLCRVDLYLEGEDIRFGELTFLPTGGLCNFQPRTYDLEFGKLFPIEKEMEKNNYKSLRTACKRVRKIAHII